MSQNFKRISSRKASTYAFCFSSRRSGQENVLCFGRRSRHFNPFNGKIE